MLNQIMDASVQVKSAASDMVLSCCGCLCVHSDLFFYKGNGAPMFTLIKGRVTEPCPNAPSAVVGSRGRGHLIAPMGRSVLSVTSASDAAITTSRVGGDVAYVDAANPTAVAGRRTFAPAEGGGCSVTVPTTDRQATPDDFWRTYNPIRDRKAVMQSE